MKGKRLLVTLHIIWEGSKMTTTQSPQFLVTAGRERERRNLQWAGREEFTLQKWTFEYTIKRFRSWDFNWMQSNTSPSPAPHNIIYHLSLHYNFFHNNNFCDKFPKKLQSQNMQGAQINPINTDNDEFHTLNIWCNANKVFPIH